MKARTLAFAAITCVAAAPAHAEVAAPELGRAAQDVRAVGHDAVLDLVHLPDGSVATLGHDGLVIRWRGDAPLAWAQFDNATDLAIAGTELTVAGGNALKVLDGALSVTRELPIDAFVACNGADALWAWNVDAHAVYALGPALEAIIPVPEAPLGDATCAWAADSLALAWDDGERARGVAQDGTPFDAEWNAQSAPRATFGQSGWEIELDPQAHAYALACDGVSAGDRQLCATPSALQVMPYVRPAVRAVFAAALLHDGVAVADRAGWTVVQLGPEDEPVVSRFDAAVVGVDRAHEGILFTCDGRDPAPQLRALQIVDGEPIASVSVQSCPVASRQTTGLPTFQAGDETFVWDAEQSAFNLGISARAQHRLVVQSAWSPYCAGIASTVHQLDAHRVFGPVCGEVHLVSVESPDGRSVGTAVCRSREGVPDAAMTPNGSPLTLPEDVHCDLDVITVSGERSANMLLAEDALRTVTGTSRGVLLQGLAENMEIIAMGDGAVLLTEGGLWVSPDLRDRIIWYDGDAPHSVRGAQTAEVWDPTALQRSFGRAGGSRLFGQRHTAP